MQICVTRPQCVKVAGILEVLTLYNVLNNTALMAIALNLPRMKTKSTSRVTMQASVVFCVYLRFTRRRHC